jgi:hypothetical protein
MRTNPTQLTHDWSQSFILHTTTYITYCPNIWKENRGAALPRLVAVFFIVLSGDYNMPWRIYIFTSSGCFFGSDFFFISSHRRLLSVYTLFSFLVGRVEREYLTGPIRYPHTLFVSFVWQPFSALRSPLHAYHSLLSLAIVSAAPFLCVTITHIALTPGK